MGTFGDTSDIISSTVDKIVTTVNETQDAFIFSTLSSYAVIVLPSCVDAVVVPDDIKIVIDDCNDKESEETL